MTKFEERSRIEKQYAFKRWVAFQERQERFEKRIYVLLFGMMVGLLALSAVL